MSVPDEDLVPKEESGSPIADATITEGEPIDDPLGPDPAPPPKRKGGRKPVRSQTTGHIQRN